MHLLTAHHWILHVLAFVQVVSSLFVTDRSTVHAVTDCVLEAGTAERPRKVTGKVSIGTNSETLNRVSR